MESVLNSWPLAATIGFVAALLIFRVQIAALIDRIRGVKVAGHSLDMSENFPKEQQKKIETTITTMTVPPTALPPPSNVYAQIEATLKNAMATANLPADVEKAWLIRTVATWQVARGHVMVYRLILGSQINLLLRANTVPSPNMDHAREIYDAAKTTYPSLYKDFSFEAWVRFPVNVGLISEEAAIDPSVLRITPLGQDFLHYLVQNSLTYLKYG